MKTTIYERGSRRRPKFGARVWESKKAKSDIVIITSILFIFLMTALFIPIIQTDLGVSSSEVGVENTLGEVAGTAASSGSLTIFNVFFTVLNVAFLDFGGVLGFPFWLDAFFFMLTITLVLTIARNIWVGGGG
jgi:hypothetical protein